VFGAANKHKILHDLGIGADPDDVFTRKQKEASAGTLIPLEDVTELRYADEAEILEIQYGTKVKTVREKIGWHIYAVLRSTLAPGATPTSWKLMKRFNSIDKPLFCLVMTLVMGGLFIGCAGMDAEELRRKIVNPPRFNPWWQSARDSVGFLVAQVGAFRAICVVVAIAAIVAGWLVFRLIHPCRAEVIVIKKERSGAPPPNG
jgi:hypothetical protein